MDDQCECICNYIRGMGRLLAWLRTQNHCTDTVCFTEHPGFQQEGSSQLMQFALIVVIWVIVALILFAFRPNSLRGSDKPRQSQGRGPPQPPGLT
eukprot:Em0015g1161a